MTQRQSVKLIHGENGIFVSKIIDNKIEVDIMEKFRGVSGFVQIRQYNEEQRMIDIDYYSGGDLLQYANRCRKLYGGIPIGKVRSIFSRIFVAIQKLHNAFYIHRDLKLENVFMDSRNNPNVGDFGLGGIWSPSIFNKKNCGSMYYAAPEILYNVQYHGPEIDMWSLGIML